MNLNSFYVLLRVSCIFPNKDWSLETPASQFSYYHEYRSSWSLRMLVIKRYMCTSLAKTVISMPRRCRASLHLAHGSKDCICSFDCMKIKIPIRSMLYHCSIVKYMFYCIAELSQYLYQWVSMAQNPHRGLKCSAHSASFILFLLLDPCDLSDGIFLKCIRDLPEMVVPCTQIFL